MGAAPCNLALCEAWLLSLRHPEHMMRACRQGRSPRISLAWDLEGIAYGPVEAWLKLPNPVAAHAMQDAEMESMMVRKHHQGCGLVADRARLVWRVPRQRTRPAPRVAPAQQDIAPPLLRGCSTGSQAPCAAQGGPDREAVLTSPRCLGDATGCAWGRGREP
jgi:hypothetical protein